MECYSMQETIKLKKHNKTEKMFNETSGGCVIPVSNNSLNDSK